MVAYTLSEPRLESFVCRVTFVLGDFVTLQGHRGESSIKRNTERELLKLTLVEISGAYCRAFSRVLRRDL